MGEHDPFPRDSLTHSPHVPPFTTGRVSAKVNVSDEILVELDGLPASDPPDQSSDRLNIGRATLGLLGERASPTPGVGPCRRLPLIQGRIEQRSVDPDEGDEQKL